VGKGEAQLSDREEEKGEEIERGKKGKNRVRQEERDKEGGKDEERDREGEKGTSGAGIEKGKGAVREKGEERQQETKDEALRELQRDASCLSPTALAPQSQLPCLPHLRWPWLTGWLWGKARQARSCRKGEEKQLLLGFCERYCFVAGTKHSTFQ